MAIDKFHGGNPQLRDHINLLVDAVNRLSGIRGDEQFIAVRSDLAGTTVGLNINNVIARIPTGFPPSPWGKIVGISGNTVTLNPCTDAAGVHVNTAVTITCWITSPQTATPSVALAVGNVVAFTRIDATTGYLGPVVQSPLFWGKLTATWTTGNTVTVNPCNQDGTNTDTSRTITVTIFSPSTVTPFGLTLTIGDVLPYWGTSSTTGLLGPIDQGAAAVPLRGIIMFSGTAAQVPANFVLCVGGTFNGIAVPDLRGKFIQGSQVVGGALTDVGTTGGSIYHGHDTYAGQTSAQDAGPNSDVGAGPPTMGIQFSEPAHHHDIPSLTTEWTNQVSGSGLHDGALPPYYILAFIIRVA